MSQFHFPWRRIRHGEKSHALWAAQPQRRCIVFIHGYGGNPDTTWPQFPMLLPGDQRFRGHDFIFYGYDALRVRIKPSAYFFRHILDLLFSSPAEDVINPTLLEGDQRSPFQYEFITVVAHSAGAVVARRALLDAQKAGAPWLSRVRLVLLAPAHQGASLFPLLNHVMASSFSLVLTQAALNYFRPIVQDLLVNSPCLELLRVESAAALAARSQASQSTDHLVAYSVIVGDKDNVVQLNQPFLQDPSTIFLKNYTHTSICKPRALDAHYNQIAGGFK